MARLTIRIDFGNGSALGPGKIRLLELIDETGSIRKAASGMKMSYRQAWLLVQSLDATFGAPLVATSTGGKSGGGAALSPLGRKVIARYRNLEAAAAKASKRDLASLTAFLAAPGVAAQIFRPQTARRARSIRKLA
jgi:molybdate transport system regulatory protein